MAFFLNSFFSTFILVFRGEFILTVYLTFYGPNMEIYFYAVIGGIVGFVANYCLGYMVAVGLVPMLDKEAQGKYNSSRLKIRNKILFLLPITSVGFINSVLILEGGLGNVFNIFGSVFIVLFAGIVTFFCGMFKSNFWKFLIIVSVARFISYYFYMFELQV